MSSFDSNGNYNKTNWKTGDKITADKLNKIEESLEIINNNDIERHKEADERLEALEEQKEVIEEELNNKATKEELNQGKADMEAMVAEVEADLEGLHARDVSTLDIFELRDGEYDDTARFQRCLDYCGLNNLNFTIPKGEYIIVNLNIPSGIFINGNGSTFKKPKLNDPPYNMTVEQMKWVRMFSLNYEGDTDSNLTTISNLNFDGNCWNMWSIEDGYAQQQASLFIIKGSNKKKGRLNVSIDNCTFKNSPSDGIHVVNDVNINISNCKSTDCFRGGLTITGGNSDINVNNFTFESLNIDDGIDVEIDSPGYGGILYSNITLSNIIIDKELDLMVSEGSKVVLNNVIMKKGFFYLDTAGELTINNSYLISETDNDWNKIMVKGTGKAMISNTTFTGVNNGKYALAQLQFYNAIEGSSIGFDNCKFYNGKVGIGGGRGQYTPVILNSCYFDDTIEDIAIGGTQESTNFAPKDLIINNCIFSNPSITLRCLSSYTPVTNVHLNNLIITNNLNTGFEFYNPIVIFNNLNLWNGIGIAHVSGGKPQYYGKRCVFVDEDPNTTNLRGASNEDIAVLKTDKTQKWKYSHQNTSSPWNHIWISISE